MQECALVFRRRIRIHSKKTQESNTNILPGVVRSSGVHVLTMRKKEAYLPIHLEQPWRWKASFLCTGLRFQTSPWSMNIFTKYGTYVLRLEEAKQLCDRVSDEVVWGIRSLQIGVSVLSMHPFRTLIIDVIGKFCHICSRLDNNKWSDDWRNRERTCHWVILMQQDKRLFRVGLSCRL